MIGRSATARVVAWTAALAAVAAVAASPALARPAVHRTRYADIPVHPSGQLTVDFHGSAAAGCARRGLCDYSGSLQWTPQSGALVLAASGGRRPKVRDALLLLDGGATSAQVNVAPAAGLPESSSSCIDARPNAWRIPLLPSHGRVRFELTGSVEALLGVRCAGPRDRAVLSRLPVPSLSYAASLRGRTTVSLAASRTFSADGFSGTIRSTLRIALGRPSAEGAKSLAMSLGPNQRFHELAVAFRATLAGTEVESFAGDPNASTCGPLGSCGATGTVTLTPPAAPAAGAALVAAGRPRVSLRSLRAALGLGGQPGRGVGAYGEAVWTASGALQASVIQGPLSCVDSAPAGQGLVVFTVGRRSVQADYATDTSRDGSPATGCPGPAEPFDPVATGSVPLSAFGSSVVHLPLHGTGGFVDDGYTGTTTSTLTLTLVRTRVRSRYATESGGTLAELLFGF